MKKLSCLATAVALGMPVIAALAEPLPALKVSENNRFLVQDLGNGQTRPFFWLGDTAWNMHRLQKADVDLYLEDRAARGFNVIQGPVLDWSGLLNGPLKRENGYNHVAYTNKSTATPSLNADVAGGEFNDYFDHADYIINKAESLGMYVALLPFWAQGINDLDDNDTEKAALGEIGRKLGDRYKNRTNVVWFVGGEAAGESPAASVRILAQGLEAGHGGKSLMGVHPTGNQSSGTDFHSDAWLDFNMLQSGHRRDRNNYSLIATDYGRTPTKPTFDSEYFYEDFKRNADAESLRGNALDVRKGAYWSVFAGGFGHTYGHDAIWQFHNGAGDVKYSSTSPSVGWKTALAAEGGSDMIHLRHLMESRPFLTRIPGQNLITAGLGGTTDGSGDHVQATRDGTAGNKDGTYIMAYIPTLKQITLDTSFIASSLLDAWWFDPRTGDATLFMNDFANTGSFTSPLLTTGPDWVLVIDDANQNYLAPGTVPEPGAAGVLGGGALALLARRRSR
jgi:hypothetical protein